jgi:uncharacterized protein with gpF-like domain
MAKRIAASSRRSRRVARHVRLAVAYERGLAGDLAKLLNRIASAAAEHVAAGREEQAAKVVDAYEASFLRMFNARMETTAMASAELVLEELTGEKALPGVFEVKFISLFEIAQNAVRSWLNSYGAAKVVAILDTTRKIIRLSLLRGHEENEPPRVLAKRIREETGGEIGKRRAVTIARTETGVAASIGADAAAEATGLQLDKVWNATEDARTRPDHAKADGQRVRMDHTFTVGGVAMRYPRDPKGPAKQVINCRCVATYEPRLPRR